MTRSILAVVLLAFAGPARADFTESGNLTVGSSVTASAFFGDGSNLTGIAPGEQKTYNSSKTFTTSVGMAISSGSVGIGTISPSVKLHVSGGGLQVSTATSGGAPALYINQTTGKVGFGTASPSENVHIATVAYGTNRLLFAENTYAGDSTSKSRIVLSQGSATWGNIDVYMESDAAGYAAFGMVGSNSVLTLTRNTPGVCFNCTNAQNSLVVQASGSVNDDGVYIKATGASSVGRLSKAGSDNTAGKLVLSRVDIDRVSITAEHSGSSWIDNAGKFGFLTQTPATTVDIAGNAQFGSGAEKSTFSATGALTIGASGSTPFQIGSSTFIVTSSARVGVGTASPSTTLQVSNSANGHGFMLPQYSQANLQSTAPAAAGVMVQGPAPDYDLFIATGTSTGQWRNVRLNQGP